MHLNKRDFLDHINVLGNDPFEMSAFKPKTKPYEVPYNGVFDSQEAAWNEANRLNAQGFGIYLGINPAVYDEVHNNLEQYRERNKAHEMIKYKWLFIDIDPITANTASRRASIKMSRRIVRDILAPIADREIGNFLIFSGSGCQIGVSIDLPKERKESVGAFLHKVNDFVTRKSNGLLKVDILNDVNRVCRAAGTINVKNEPIRAALLNHMNWSNPLKGRHFPTPLKEVEIRFGLPSRWDESWRVEDVINAIGFRKEGNGELGGVNPWHGGSPHSFKINFHKDVWYCNRCGVGGNGFQALALLEGIVKDCGQVHRMTREQNAQVFEAARRKKLID
jgi:hypothetical protein